jgi:hypothetical protein
MFTMEHGDHASGSPFDGTAADKVRVARGVGQRATLRQLDLAQATVEPPIGGGRFDAALANFGPLNRLSDRRPVGRALAPWLRLVAVEGLGLLPPPPVLEHLARRAPRTVAGIARLQRRLARAWPISRRGDHTMLTFRRAGAAE